MSIEKITLFSELHAEPSWLQDLRKKAFDKIDQLELPAIERVKFHRWKLLSMFLILPLLIQI